MISSDDVPGIKRNSLGFQGANEFSPGFQFPWSKTSNLTQEIKIEILDISCKRSRMLKIFTARGAKPDLSGTVQLPLQMEIIQNNLPWKTYTGM